MMDKKPLNEDVNQARVMLQLSPKRSNQHRSLTHDCEGDKEAYLATKKRLR